MAIPINVINGQGYFAVATAAPTYIGYIMILLVVAIVYMLLFKRKNEKNNFNIY